ncbi:1-phosphofructokinase family hexose kinase [Catenuloplanes atrovinosus]|uniref:1-phosphofructokinase n=1 Tax=Catenuloplanes atrovinosus TaxID=137266 RepID=A0AAE3YJU9_9ACTN|nr:PfkB family carbohydrate kinase [Catenuloplanes atrovinosus]MDR7275089.1 1-phosphofructokinase [Catenuloplanes atrovinosus]
MDARVMVFSAVPILTVTIEDRADRPELHVHAGGQGVWMSRMIAALGVPVTLCVSLGGETGDVVRTRLGGGNGDNIDVRSVKRDSGTGWYVHDRRSGERDEIASDGGEPLTRHDLDELYGLALTEGLRSPVAVLSGSADPGVVDPDIYRRLAADLGNNDVTVVVDLSGDDLTAVLRGRPAFVKVSHEELINAGRASGDDEKALIEAGRGVLDEGAGAVLISRPHAPSLAIFDGRVVTVEPPALEVADHRGAGDSMTAGIASVLARGGDMEEAVRTGAAAGALNVTRHGLGTGNAEAIAELIGRVRVENR